MLTILACMACMALSQSCDIHDEVTRISMREALRTEVSLGQEIKSLESDMQDREKVLLNKIDALESQLYKLKTEVQEDVKKDMMQDVAWQALHAAAAAACRGSTATGGHGPWGNGVYPKKNDDSCDNICGATSLSICDADISIEGYYGKATSYSQKVGLFYNYGCSGAGNTNVKFDEVKSDEDAILTGSSSAYYRFCCCRKP
jgi:hypothetical protein